MWYNNPITGEKGITYRDKYTGKSHREKFSEYEGYPNYVVSNLGRAYSKTTNKELTIMSNSRIRKEIAIKETKNKVYTKYRGIESLLLNYQMCKAYFNDSSISMLGVVEKIIKTKYNLPWQRKFIRKAIMGARGKSNALISIPQFKFEERVNDILSKFVKRNFDKMVIGQRKGFSYPFAFRNIVEKELV